MYSEDGITEKSKEESGVDMDWYFRDKNGKLAVVASGGGMLPDSVSVNPGQLEKTIAFFRSLPVLSKDIIIEEPVLKRIQDFTQPGKDAYVKDLFYMASRGFYYFDKEVLNNFSDFKYYLKAKPTAPLYFEKLDENLRATLPIVFMNEDLDNLKFFFVNAVG